MSIPVIENWRFSKEEKRAIAIHRAMELKKKIGDYLEQKDSIKTGFDMRAVIEANKEKILFHLNATIENWNDWRWQMANRISDIESLRRLFGLDEKRLTEIKKVGTRYRWAISPYFASLIEPGKSNDPIMAQCVPSIEEMDEAGYDDPMAEEFTSPSPCVTRRYPDRLIINATNRCASYCRHCQRRRNIGEVDRHKSLWSLRAALEYVRKNKEIRDVLITGGDALLLDNKIIEWLLDELDKIKHVEIKRLGTRVIVTLPQRITPDLCTVLKKHPPVYINTQFNHPRSITPESKDACDKLIDAGVVLGNQAVLLKGINNDANVMKKLNQELLKIRVRPYYLFHAKPVKGTRHFITSVDEGLEIVGKLRGFTSGLAIPTYIINAPNGQGKVPVLPSYLLGYDDRTVSLRNWEGREIKFSAYPE